jgi:hypothetical protein
MQHVKVQTGTPFDRGIDLSYFTKTPFVNLVISVSFAHTMWAGFTGCW